MTDSPSSSASQVPVDSPPRRSLVRRVLEWTLLLLVVASVAGLLGDLWWIFDLCNHFRFQYALLLIAFVLLSLWRRRWTSLLFASVALLINVILIALLFVNNPTSAINTRVDAGLQLLAFNVHTANRRFDDVTSFIDQSRADLVVLQEIDDEWDRAIRGNLAHYKVLMSVPRPDNFGMAVLVRIPPKLYPDSGLEIEHVKELEIAQGLSQVPTIEILARWHGRPIAILGLHTLPPINATIAHVRDAQLHGAGLWALAQRKDGIPAIIIGDLNATPWCAPFRRLCEDASLVNSQVGHGLQGSFHAKLPGFLRIPIDHCLHSRDLAASGRFVGPDAFGSDHLPLTVIIHWRPQ